MDSTDIFVNTTTEVYEPSKSINLFKTHVVWTKYSYEWVVYLWAGISTGTGVGVCKCECADRSTDAYV